jgi:hypothetical protein
MFNPQNEHCCLSPNYVSKLCNILIVGVIGFYYFCTNVVPLKGVTCANVQLLVLLSEIFADLFTVLTGRKSILMNVIYFFLRNSKNYFVKFT